MYWRLPERDVFAATDDGDAETELVADVMTAGVSCFETALGMEWPVLLDKREAVRESMLGLLFVRCLEF